MIKEDYQEYKEPIKNITFADEEGNIYSTYTSLDKLMIPLSRKDIQNKVLSIGNQMFRVQDNLSAFTFGTKKTYLNINCLLGLTTKIESQVLVIKIHSENENDDNTLYYVYLSRFSLIKDPRRKENNGMLTMLLDSLVIDFPYKKETDNKSNLVVNIHGVRLHCLIN